MDLSEQMRSESEERNSSSKDNSPSTQIKSCSDCHTTKTPLWRGGPAGPKSLCNACGIKYNKKRRQILGLDRGRNDKGKKRRKSCEGAVSSGESTEIAQSLRMRWMALKGETALRRSEKLLSQLREEEQAAILLMALSYGSVYA